MATATLTSTGVPKKWRRLLRTIPGYDPVATAEDAWFDAKAAEYYIEFIETCCTHIEGDKHDTPFLLEDWEKAIVANLFGWYRRDFLDRIVRRYRKSLIYVPRKNGKTPLVAAIHNAIFFLDDEAGQMNNLAAASRKQASVLLRHIVGMIHNEPMMEARCTIYEGTRRITKPDNSVTKVIPADHKVAHGDNQHFGAVDELHAQPNRKLVDVLTTGMASANRIQPLIVFLTTADWDRPSICNEEYGYACKVRDGIRDDVAYLPVIYEASKEDDWTKLDTWQKANPNLGVSVSVDYLRGECKKAQENPAYENTFKRLHLNMRTEQAEKVIPMDAWDACQRKLDLGLLARRPCWGGLDIGATRDFVAFELVFPHQDVEAVTLKLDPEKDDSEELVLQRGTYSTMNWFWLPENPRHRDSRMADQIRAWCKQGYIITTPGDVVDYDQVARDIEGFTKPYSLQSMAIDQGFQGMAITITLQKLFGEDRIVAFRQGILSMAAPFRELLEMLINGTLLHDDNPVMRWMASNVAAEQRGGLIKASKDKSTEKIDGITALTMALGVALISPGPQRSAYEDHGIRCLGWDNE